ncbi:hypothetical protein [Streptomyces sp. NPDC046939]|uniref:hypothetical protein n=1 Tax=Streptomyces sp. NPDC046939 TaxID=3155376 RepID=UPI0033FD6BA8
MAGRDLWGCSYVERRAALLDVLEPLGPPLEAVAATDDVDVARVWFEALPAQGVEGIDAKRATGLYRPDRPWREVRHSETVDADVIGYTGARRHPKHLAVRLPDGRTAQTQTLPPALAVQVAAHLSATDDLPVRHPRTRPVTARGISGASNSRSERLSSSRRITPPRSSTP